MESRRVEQAKRNPASYTTKRPNGNSMKYAYEAFRLFTKYAALPDWRKQEADDYTRGPWPKLDNMPPKHSTFIKAFLTVSGANMFKETTHL